jgi:hypothetical protein
LDISTDCQGRKTAGVAPFRPPLKENAQFFNYQSDMTVRL